MHPFQSLLHFCQVKIKNHLNGFLRGSSCRSIEYEASRAKTYGIREHKVGGDDSCWRAVILKEQQHSYQHSVENEWMVTQHRHRGMLFASVNGFISQFALGSARAHGTLTARSSLPACSGAFWKSIDYLVPTSSRKDASPLMIPMPTGISDVET